MYLVRLYIGIIYGQSQSPTTINPVTPVTTITTQYPSPIQLHVIIIISVMVTIDLFVYLSNSIIAVSIPWKHHSFHLHYHHQVSDPPIYLYSKNNNKIHSINRPYDTLLPPVVVVIQRKIFMIYWVFRKRRINRPLRKHTSNWQKSIIQIRIRYESNKERTMTL